MIVMMMLPRSASAQRVLLSFVLVGVLMALGAAPALALRGHVFGFAFGTAGPGEGQLKEPSDVAVNEATGQVYVLDQGNARIERFSSAGAYEAQFDGSETPAKVFNFGTEALSGGIAVDNSCYFKNLSETTEPSCKEADPSNSDVYVTDRENGVVDKFSATGEYLGPLQDPAKTAGCEQEVKEEFAKEGKSKYGGTTEEEAVRNCAAFKDEPTPIGIGGVGVDTNGTVWVDYEGGAANGFVATFTNREPSLLISARALSFDTCCFRRPGFAVDSKGRFYGRGARSEPLFVVTQYDSSGEVLSSPFPPEPPETRAVAVDLVSDAVFLDDVSSVGVFSPNGVLQERFGPPGSLTSGSGLAVGHENANRANTTVYVADSAANVVGVFAPEPPGPPIVREGTTSVLNVNAGSATFAAEVGSHGASTEYRFEYGRCGVTLASCATSVYEESVPVPDGFVGSDFEFYGVHDHVQDLVAGTAYHVRVVAHNEKGTVFGEERSFVTQSAGGNFALPDARQWELVTPPFKYGATIYPVKSAEVIQASATGDAITYPTSAPMEPEPPGYPLVSQELSLRGRGGWSSRAIDISRTKPAGVGVGFGREYRFFSADLSRGVLQPLGAFNPSLSPEASEQTPYLRTTFTGGDVNAPCLPAAMPCYRPLVTGAPGYENVPPGTPFGEQCDTFCGPLFLGGTPDASSVVLSSKVALTAGGPQNGLYEWSAAAPAQEALRLVSVLPRTGEEEKNGEEGKPANSAELGAGGSGAGGLEAGNARHAISNDGSRVIWGGTSTEGIKHLYLRDVVRGETVQLDAVQGGSGEEAVAPVFQDASGDGSRVFFTDLQRLTKDSGGLSSQGYGDLYECAIVIEAGKLKCDLSDLTPSNEEGKSADVQGTVAASGDGSYVYFVANGVLASHAVPGKCASNSSPGAVCNLYVRQGGVTTLIAVLSGEDSPDWAGLNHLTGRVSPGGRWLAFMSQRSLTGYDNRDAVSGKLDEEVFLYDASSARLVCASCDPTGARPAGVEYAKVAGKLVGGSGVWPQAMWLAANIPGWTPYFLNTALYQSRYLSDSGRLFFNANDALVSQDVNGSWDVYQYEPSGVGGCVTVSVTFSEGSGGCVGLVSSGSSPDESGFLDASESGGDVFFLTKASLVSQDLDTSLDVYDAHVCSGFSPCFPVSVESPPVCVTEASCRPALSPQPDIFGAPASWTFSGPGNLLAPFVARTTPPRRHGKCKRGLVRRHGRCVKKKRVKRSARRRRG